MKFKVAKMGIRMVGRPLPVVLMALVLTLFKTTTAIVALFHHNGGKFLHDLHLQMVGRGAINGVANPTCSGVIKKLET